MGCLKSIFFLVLLVVAAIFAFINRDRIRSAWADIRGREIQIETGPSSEVADRAAAKLADMESGKVRLVALGQNEIQSLLRYRYRELLPAFIDSPEVTINGDRIQMRGRIPLERLPQLDELGEVARFLPDTTELGITGKLLPLQYGRVAFAVDQVRAARIPLPHRLVPGALRKLGRKDEPGLPADALAIPLPPGADAAYVRGDSLVFLSNARN